MSGFPTKVFIGHGGLPECMEFSHFWVWTILVVNIGQSTWEVSCSSFRVCVLFVETSHKTSKWPQINTPLLPFAFQKILVFSSLAFKGIDVTTGNVFYSSSFSYCFSSRDLSKWKGLFVFVEKAHVFHCNRFCTLYGHVLKVLLFCKGKPFLFFSLSFSCWWGLGVKGKPTGTTTICWALPILYLVERVRP